MTARMFQIVSNTVRMHVSEILFSFVSAVPNRFKYRHNACFRDIVFKKKSAVPNRFKYRQASECTIYRHCFQNILCSSKSFQIPSGCMLQRYCFIFFLLCSSKSFKLPFSTPVFGSCKSHCQNACLKDIVFKIFSAAPNCFKYHHNVYFRGIVPGSYTPRTSDWIIW